MPRLYLVPLPGNKALCLPYRVLPGSGTPREDAARVCRCSLWTSFLCTVSLILNYTSPLPPRSLQTPSFQVVEVPSPRSACHLPRSHPCGGAQTCTNGSVRAGGRSGPRRVHHHAHHRAGPGATLWGVHPFLSEPLRTARNGRTAALLATGPARASGLLLVLWLQPRCPHDPACSSHAHTGLLRG